MAPPVWGIAIPGACKYTIPMKNDRSAKGWWDWDNKIPQHLTGVLLQTSLNVVSNLLVQQLSAGRTKGASEITPRLLNGHPTRNEKILLQILISNI